MAEDGQAEEAKPEPDEELEGGDAGEHAAAKKKKVRCLACPARSSM